MSKETMMADPCACGQRIQFKDHHWPHCTHNPKNVSARTRAHLESTFTPRQLAIIEANGPTVETLQASQRGADRRAHDAKRGKKRPSRNPR